MVKENNYISTHCWHNFQESSSEQWITKCFCANIKHPQFEVNPLETRPQKHFSYGKERWHSECPLPTEAHTPCPASAKRFPGYSRAHSYKLVTFLKTITSVNILESALDADDPHHILCALPTGFGKTMPMLLLGHLLPPGAGCNISDPYACTSQCFEQDPLRWSWSPSSQSSCSSWTTARGWACQSLLAARCVIYFWQREQLNWYSYPMGEIGFSHKPLPTGFNGRIWGKIIPAASNLGLQRGVFVFKEGGQRIALSHFYRAALAGEGRHSEH